MPIYGDGIEAFGFLTEHLHPLGLLVPVLGQLPDAAATCRRNGNLGPHEEGVPGCEEHDDGESDVQR